MQQDEITTTQELSESQSSLLDSYLRGCLQEDGTFNIDPPRLSDMEIFNSNSEEEECQNVTVTQFHLENNCPNPQNSSSLLYSSLENNCPNSQNSSSLPYSSPNQSTVVPNIIQLPEMAPSTVLASACIPSKKSWTGDYGFDVHFEATNKNSWIYSMERNKLYVSKGAPCPIGISTKRNAPNDCRIKVQAMFSQPQPSRAQEIVERCLNHALDDAKIGHKHPYHLIRCECDSACYDEPGENGQLSVSFPFQRPQIGESYSTYIFKFMCFGSCTGGPNRRPLLMIFTLERGGVVLGRRAVDLKICACPARDFRNDDKLTQAHKTAATPPPKKRKADSDRYVEHVADVFQFIEKMQLSGNKAEAPTKDGTYTISVTDRATYRFLRHAKFMYEMFRFMTRFSPAVTGYLKSANKKTKRDHDSTDTSD